MRGLAAAVAVVALVLTGCGGDDEQGAPAPEEPAATETAMEGAEADGAQVFASAGCGSCHTLAAAGSTGTTGPNLDQLQPSVEQVAQQVRTGGGGMPSFEDQLTDAEIQAVAQYVAESAGG